MRNLILVVMGIFFLLSMYAYAGEKENLQKTISDTVKTVTLNELREVYDDFKPGWQAIRKELSLLQQAPLDTEEQRKEAQKKLVKIERSCQKIELIKKMGVLVAGTITAGDNLPEGEIENTIVKILELETALEKADSWQEITRIKLRLIGMGWPDIRSKGHPLVTQYALKWYLKSLHQGNVLLIAWWEKNNKSVAGLEKLKTIQKTLLELEAGTNTYDRKQLNMLHMRASTDIEDETLMIFIQEP